MRVVVDFDCQGLDYGSGTEIWPGASQTLFSSRIYALTDDFNKSHSVRGQRLA